MVFFSTTGLLLHVALFPPGTTHDCAIGQAGPSIWSRLPPTILTGVHMRLIGLAVVLATGFLLVTPVAEAQPAKIARIGLLSAGVASDSELRGRMAHINQALRDGLAESGFVENRSVIIEYRWAEEKEERLPVLAAELVRHSVDVIIAPGPSAIRAAKSTTGTLPIVGIDLESDPVAAGFAASFARPGGNITGVFLDQADLSGKWLELLKEAVPKLIRVAVVWDTSTPPLQLNAIKMAAKTLSLTVLTLELRGPNQFERVFEAAARSHAQGVVMLSSLLISRRGRELAAASVAKRLPTISMFRENV